MKKNLINILFELIYGLYILNNRLNIIHNDIHFGNIIFKELKKSEKKIYTINNMDILKQRNFRLCIYDFDYSYFQGYNNPGIDIPDEHGRINKSNPLTILDKGRDIYNLGNDLISLNNLEKILGPGNFMLLFEDDSEDGTVNILKLLFDSDKIIQNLKNARKLANENNQFWNRYCNATPIDFYVYRASNPYGYMSFCDKLPDSYNVDKITPDKVLLRFLKNNRVRKDILEIKTIDPLFKKFLKNF